MTTIFVYGTLRPGGSQHARMSAATYIGPATVVGRLYRIDWYPGLVRDPAGDIIQGDLYRLDPTTLTALDEFEGPDYQRVETTAQSPADTRIQLWEWHGSVDESRRIHTGDWLSPA